jgi:hypothetical protein
VDGAKGEVVGFGERDDGKAADSETVYEIGAVTHT